MRKKIDGPDVAADGEPDETELQDDSDAEGGIGDEEDIPNLYGNAKGESKTARIKRLREQHPEWNNAQIAREVGCTATLVGNVAAMQDARGESSYPHDYYCNQEECGYECRSVFDQEGKACPKCMIGLLIENI